MTISAKHPQTVLSAEGLTLSFGALAVLDDFSIDIANGEIVVLLGASGCGKSSLLDVLTGMLPAQRGEVRKTLGVDRIGYLMQDESLLPWRTLYGNAVVGCQILGCRYDKTIIAELLSEFGILEAATLLPGQASEGMRQRAALVRTFAHDPDLVLLDEPFAHIDLPRKLEIQKWLLEIARKKHKSVIIVTHDFEDAITMADRILVLRGPPLRVHAVLQLPPRENSSPVGFRSSPAFGKYFQEAWKAMTDGL